MLEPLAAAEESEHDDDDGKYKAHDDVEGVRTPLKGKRNIHSIDARDYGWKGENYCEGCEKTNCFIELIGDDHLNGVAKAGDDPERESAHLFCLFGC